MKKKGLILFLAMLFSFSLVITSVSAEEVNGEELVTNGEFTIVAGELVFPDPVFGAEYGVAQNWGSGSWDSAAIAVKDPEDATNTVLKLSYSVPGKNWSSFFRFLSIQQNTTYHISIDYKVEGTTDNLGMRFAGSPALEIVFLDHASKTPIDGKSGWYNVQFDFSTGTGTYDSIAMWFNSNGSPDNIAYIDNIIVEADESETNINVGGDFEGFLDYAPQSLTFPDPVFGPEFGVAALWGSGVWDSAAIAQNDPADVTNTIMKLSLSVPGKSWSSFFRFLTIAQNTLYHISIDYKIVGTTDNLGFRFAGSPSMEVALLDHASKTAIDGKDGWYNVTFDYATGTGTYDSIAMWFNTLGSEENMVYVDNISIKADGSETNINVGGDFEGFLDYAYAPESGLTAEANSYGYFGSSGVLTGENVILHDGGVLGFETILKASKYMIALTFSVPDAADTNLSVMFANATNPAIGSVALLTNGVANVDIVTYADGIYTVLTYVTASEVPTSLQFSFSGSVDVTIDNLSLKEVITIPDSPFDPDTTYYAGSNQVVNGDFEAFGLDTLFSETQLEGAWGSVSLDGPAKIASMDSSKVMKIGKTDGKTYSSSFLITPPTFEVDDLIRFSYDYKLVTANSAGSYLEINSAFVGATNTSYYKIDLRSITDGGLTSGAEILKMPVVITDRGDGWFTVTLDIQISTVLLIKCNSIRWLFTPVSADDVLYIDNVSIAYLSDEVPTNLITSLTINEPDQDILVAAEKQLTVSVNPTDADDLASIVWSTSNAAIATVDQTGKVTAVGAGACEISVANADASVFDKIVISVSEPVVENPGLGASWYYIIGSFVTVLSGVTVFIVLKMKKK
jgi:uncharacterized protein YjdB